MNDHETWTRLGRQLRIDSIRASSAAGSGHPTSSMSAAYSSIHGVVSSANFQGPLRSLRRLPAERVAAAVQGREPAGKHANYQGKVTCFFEIGDGKGTLLQFDDDHPPRPPKPNRLWHLAKVDFNKTYWHTVPRGRV